MRAYVVSMTQCPSCFRRLQLYRSFLITPIRSGGCSCSRTNRHTAVGLCAEAAFGEGAFSPNGA